MDNRYYGSVISAMQDFLNQNSFKADENGIFSNESKKVEVKFSEERQMYILSVADIIDGQVGDFREISSWLFDDSQTEKDTEAVAIDFVSSLKKELGIKSTRSTVSNKIELPTGSKTGKMDIQGFTKKMLDVYPVLKEEYKNHIADYGNFLYLNFFGKNLVPLYKATFVGGNKKQIKKLYDVLADAYLRGDNDTVNTMIALLCAAAYNDDNVTKEINEMLEVDGHFKAAFNSFIPVLAKNKKLLSALVI